MLSAALIGFGIGILSALIADQIIPVRPFENPVVYLTRFGTYAWQSIRELLSH